MAGSIRIRKLQTSQSEAPPRLSAKPFKRSNGRVSYPHRMSLDLSEDQYKWLRRQAFEAHVPAATYLRVIMDHLQQDVKMSRVISDKAGSAAEFVE